MSQNNDIIYLPTSLGEAIDKLTILDIKLDKIKDDRRIDVQKEYNLLYEKLDHFIIKYNDLYQTMKKVNVLIWDMMDILRDGETSEAEYLKICKECIDYNDIRFRVKNKINYVSKSSLKEQKSYKINRIFLEINKDIQNISDFFKPIKHYSFIYDEIVICSNNEELKHYFEYDSTIVFIICATLEDVMVHTTNKEYKKQYYFLENSYEKEKIYEIFDLNYVTINII